MACQQLPRPLGFHRAGYHIPYLGEMLLSIQYLIPASSGLGMFGTDNAIKGELHAPGPLMYRA